MTSALHELWDTPEQRAFQARVEECAASIIAAAATGSSLSACNHLVSDSKSTHRQLVLRSTVGSVGSLPRMRGSDASGSANIQGRAPTPLISCCRRQ